MYRLVKTTFISSYHVFRTLHFPETEYFYEYVSQWRTRKSFSRKLDAKGGERVTVNIPASVAAMGRGAENNFGTRKFKKL